MGLSSDMTSMKTEQASLSAILRKYGLFMGLIFLNSKILIYVFYYLMVAVLQGMPSFEAPYRDDYYSLLLLINELSAYLVPLLSALVLFRKECEEAPKGEYRRFPGDSILIFVSGIALASFGTMAMSFITNLFNRLFNTPLPTAAFSDSMPGNLLQFLIFLVCTVIIAPLCEEVIFRKLLLFPLRKYGDFPAVLLSAVIFALYHGNIDQLPYAVIAGFFFGIVAVRTNSIIPTIILHAVNNLLVAVVSYMPKNIFGDSASDLNKVSDITSAVSFFLTLIIPLGVIFAVILGILKVYRLNNPSTLSGSEKLRCFYTSLPFLAGLFAMLLLFF